MSSLLAEIEAEARTLIAELSAGGVEARLLGGIAIHQHLHRPLPATLARTYADIDIVCRGERRQALRTMLEARGYVPNTRFNSLHGSRRLLFYDEEHGRQLDVIFDELRMSHTLNLVDRLSTHATTLSPADLLLTKLQIVELNRKDIADALTLVHQHELAAERNGDVLGVDRLESVTSRDWGWFTTVMDNLERLAEAAPNLLDSDDLTAVDEKLAEIRRRLEEAPKSVRWKARARVGRHVVWYELPEEVGSGADV